MDKKIKTICIDTLTALQTDEYMKDLRTVGHDKWKDYGKTIYSFIIDIQRMGFELILILGEPGTGKSSGQMTLPSHTNIWYNADDKNPVWEGGREEYGKKTAPKAPFHIIPKTYKEILEHLQKGLNGKLFEEDRYAFVLGHTEIYKAGNDSRERLKTLGNLATKMQIEGKNETVLYSVVEMDSGKPVFLLETQNNGFNTARSHQNMFENKIPNDYGMIIERLSKY